MNLDKRQADTLIDALSHYYHKYGKLEVGEMKAVINMFRNDEIAMIATEASEFEKFTKKMVKETLQQLGVSDD